MGQTVGDFNRDGLPDWYVTSIMDCPSCDWTGNKLYINQGNHQYVEIANAAGVDYGGYGWGTVAVDFNHDGWVDLAEVNGSNGPQFADFTKLWLNNTDGTFSEVAQTSGIVLNGYSRGLIHLDYDNDGDMDLVIVANEEPTRLFRNDLSGANRHFLRVLLDTSGSPDLAPAGLNSRVDVTIDGVTQSVWVTAGDNFLSSSEPSAHFGLGSASSVDLVRVTWADGSQTRLFDVQANDHLTVHSGPAGMEYCSCAVNPRCDNASGYGGCTNSAGQGARLVAEGSSSLSADDLVLRATHLPGPQFGLVFMGQSAGSPAIMGDGWRCIDGPLYRFPVRTSNASGDLIEGPGIASHVAASFPMAAQIAAGSAWNFQTWYRDPSGPCGTNSNVSNALRVIFRP